MKRTSSASIGGSPGSRPATTTNATFLAFLNPAFLRAYGAWRYGGAQPSEYDRYLWDPGFDFRKASGDILYTRMDSLIRGDSVAYYGEYRAGIFYERNPESEPDAVIDADREALLRRIADLTTKSGVDYRIVITPNYDQVAMNDEDLSLIRELFDPSRVYDFSGANAITNEVGNYYEERHFKPYVARRLMMTAYR